MIDKNDVVSIVTLTGEFVGKFISESDTQYEIDDPRLLMQDENGIAFIPAVCMTGEQKPSKVFFNKSITAFIVKTAEEVQKEYRKVTSGLIL
jgi:hypothetical protein